MTKPIIAIDTVTAPTIPMISALTNCGSLDSIGRVDSVGFGVDVCPSYQNFLFNKGSLTLLF